MELGTHTDRGSNQETTRYFSALREHPLLIVAVLAFSVMAAIAIAVRSPDRYEAQTDVLVSPVSSDNPDLAGLGLLSDPTGAVFTAARLVNTPQVTGDVLRDLRLRIPRRDLLAKITVTPLPQSNSFTILARADTPKSAARLANAFAASILQNRSAAFQKRLREAISRLERQKASLRGADSAAVTRDLSDRLAYLEGFLGGGDPTLEVINAAVPPDVPAAKSKLSVVVAFVAALLLGTGLALLLELLSPRIRGNHDLPSGVPVLARIPYLPERSMRRFFSGRGHASADALEPYRILRAKLAGIGRSAESPACVLVTSASTGDGKTRTAAGLAAAIAASGRSVILVDADLRGSGVTAIFDLEASQQGLVSLLRREPVDLDRALVPAADRWPGLRILPPGPEATNAVDLLEPSRVEAVMAELAGEADVIVFDSPPITEFAEAIVLAGVVDAVLVAVRLSHTRQDRLQEALQVLERVGIPPLGMVVAQRRGSRGGSRRRRTPARQPRPQRASAGTRERAGVARVTMAARGDGERPERPVDRSPMGAAQWEA
jgi:capsular exopolysaccharide synthesis family protein